MLCPRQLALALLKNLLLTKAAKWSEQKDAVAELTKLASTKRIAPGDFSEICHTLKKVITDVNIAVAVEAIQAIGNLARGLRAHFSGRSRLLLPVLLCLSDGTPEVRDAAFSALSAIAKLVGMRPLEKSIEKLDDVRRKKLSEMIAGASESDVAVPSSGAIVPSSTAADGSFVRRSATSMLNGKKAVQAAPINKKVVPAKPGVSKKGNGAGQLKLSKSVDVEDVEPEDMSLDILRAE